MAKKWSQLLAPVTFLLLLLKFSAGAATDGEELLRLIQRSFTPVPTDLDNFTTTAETVTSSTESPLELQQSSPILLESTQTTLVTEDSGQLTELPIFLTSTTINPPTTRAPREIKFPPNITLSRENVSYYADILRHDVPAGRRLEYLNFLSDAMRQENKFQDDFSLQEFAQLFHSVLNESKRSGQSWSKKIERKNVKRLLKYALNSDALNPDLEGSGSVDCGAIGAEYKWLDKSFYKSLTAHSESEAYEILMEVIELRNLTLSVDQIRSIQCLYYSSFSGMSKGRAYVFGTFDEDWDVRNSLFGRPLILESLRQMVAQLIGLTPTADKPSKFMQEIFTVFSEYKSRLDQETKTRPRKSAKYFHDVVAKLEGSLMGMKKWDNFVDCDSKDVMTGAGLEVIMDATGEVFDSDKSPIVFDPINRQSWHYLQLLRPAGAQVFQKYEDFLGRMVVKKMSQVYKARIFRRRFSSAFLHLRLLPTGPLILKGAETLKDLMAEAEPRDKVDNRIKIDNFYQTLKFLQGLYSTNEEQLNSLPQQVQFLTNPELNQNLKLMLRYAPQDDEIMQFAEVGVVFQDGAPPQLGFRPFPFIMENGTDLSQVFKNEWSFHLGYFRGFSETLFAPVIKAFVLMADQVDGGLGYNWRDGGSLIYNEKLKLNDEDGGQGFWDLKLMEHEQSFQLIHHGRLEQFFSVVTNENGFPTGLKASHFIPDSVPEGFKPAEFFVVPAGTGDYDS